MFRFFQRRKARNNNTKNKQTRSSISITTPVKDVVEETITEPTTSPEGEDSQTTTREYDDDESIYSSDSSSSGLSEIDHDDDDHPPAYMSHSFQQQFHELHPPSGVNNSNHKMTNLSSFMLHPASNNNKKKPENPPTKPAWWNFERDYQEDADASMNLEIEDDDEEEEQEIAFVEESRTEDAPEAHLHFAKHSFLKPRMDDLDLDGNSSASDDDEEDTSFAHFDPQDLNNFFLEDAPVRPPNEPLNVEQCFKNVQLMTPEHFDTLKEATAKEKAAEKQTESPTLSDFVSVVNPKLFEEPEVHSDLSMSIVSHQSAATNVSMSTHPESILQMSQYTLTAANSNNKNNTGRNKFDTVRKKLASSFKSRQFSGQNNRVSYSLGKGKKGMSKKERLYATSLLPAKPLLSAKQRSDSSSAIPRSITLRNAARSPLDRPLSILLLSPIAKIFEIVLVDVCLSNTTIGDTLCKARATATDVHLSEQKYVSLCNRQQELAAPMLPVSLLVEQCLSGGGRTEEDRRAAMEGRLLVAVPDGSTSTECQAIRRMLWKNPRIQRWWKLTDPFGRPNVPTTTEVASADDDDDSVTVPEQTRTVPQPPRASKRNRKKAAKKLRRENKVPYQRLSDDNDKEE